MLFVEDLILSKALIAALVTVLLTGCAGTPDAPAPKTPEKALRERVTAYFQALVAQDYRKAYEFFAPGYRSTWSVTDHYQIHPIIGTWLAGEVLAIECPSAEVCDVTVSTRFRFNAEVEPLGGQELPMDMKYRWLKTEGEWYYLPQG